MIYDWVTSKWTEYSEGLSSIEMSSTKEIKCVKLVHDGKIKIYATMQPNGIDGANPYFLLEFQIEMNMKYIILYIPHNVSILSKNILS